jgi:uncharacterized spore protein YtfJ
LKWEGKMEEVQNLIKTTVGEIEKMLNARTVVGDPININGKTLIPLISVGFAFGAGSGSGKESDKPNREGFGGGGGGGAGIKPTAVIIIDKETIRIEPIRGGLSAALEKMAETAMPMMMQKCGQGQEQGGNK